MITTRSNEQVSFYREFLMARGRFSPEEFGVSLSKEEFIDQMVDTFNAVYRDMWTIDELCLHPTEAARFCGEVRHKFGYYDLPDDIILRVVMQRRKRPE